MKLPNFLPSATDYIMPFEIILIDWYLDILVFLFSTGLELMF